MAEQWASHDKAAFMLAPGCVCVRACICVCVCMCETPNAYSSEHTVRNTDAFMDSFAHTHSLLFPLVQKRVSSGSCQALSHREQWASQKQPPRLSLHTHTHIHCVWCEERDRMRCLGQMLDQLSMLHTKSLCTCVCMSIRLSVRLSDTGKAICQ